MLRSYSHDWLLGIEDISDAVAEQRLNVQNRAFDRLLTPVEELWPVTDAVLAARLGVTPT